MLLFADVPMASAQPLGGDGGGDAGYGRPDDAALL